MLVSVVSDTLWPPWSVAHQAPLSVAFPSKNTGFVCHALLQGFFPTWGSKLCFLRCWQIFYRQSHREVASRKMWAKSGFQSFSILTVWRKSLHTLLKNAFLHLLIWANHFLLLLVDVVDYAEWFSYIKPVLHTWDKSHLVMVYNSSYAWLDMLMFCWGFLHGHLKDISL